jgi:hypothetical protein
MTKTKRVRGTKGRSWTRAWPIVTLSFAVLLFGGLATHWDPIEAQQPKQKTKVPEFGKKSGYVPGSKNVPIAKSLTNGQKIDAAKLTKLIDQEINKRLQADKVKSTGLCDDFEFIRRAYLDIVGVIPSASKVTAFLESKEVDKRSKLIDELLSDPRFGSYLAEMWAIHLIPRESNNRALQQKPLEGWLAENFNKNTPLDKLVYDLVTATGEVDKNPAGLYFVANPTVDKITDNATRMFLGVQLQCAQCHNHPFTDWKQTEYWAMATFFLKTKVNGTPQQAAKKGVTLAVSENPNQKVGKKGGGLPESFKNVPAKFLQGDQPTLDPKGPARPTLGKWMTSADNKFFARAMVNRFWHSYFGRGLVNPVDDMHDDNAATHPELLSTLTEQFKLNGFDVKYLIRAICNSDAYQRSSVSSADAASVDLDVYSRRELRVMTPEQLYDSLAVVLGQAAKGEAKDKTVKKGPQSPRDNFINFFRVEDMNPLEYQNGIPQALRLMNSPFTNKSDVVAAQLTSGTKTPAEAIDKIYLTALARRPNARELERLTAYVNRPGATPRAAYGDILWVLLNGSEFVHNH